MKQKPKNQKYLDFRKYPVRRDNTAEETAKIDAFIAEHGVEKCATHAAEEALLSNFHGVHGWGDSHIPTDYRTTSIEKQESMGGHRTLSLNRLTRGNTNGIDLVG